MSENRLLFVPSDPGWQPTFDAAGRAVAFLASIAPNADEICVSFTERMIFHPGGGNWSGVQCPSCESDIEAWLFDRLRHLHESRILVVNEDLRQTTPCCNSCVSLNDLHYGWPAAFGRFSLAARRPGILTSKEQENEIATRLGRPVRKIWERI